MPEQKTIFMSANIGIPEIITIIFLKIVQSGIATNAKMDPKDGDSMATPIRL